MTITVSGIGPARVRGFTLLEVLAVVVIVAILLVFAVPSFNSLIQGSRIVGDASALANDLSFARSEAMKRRNHVMLCATTNGTACEETEWTHGWLVFLDADGDGALTGNTVQCPPTPTTEADCFLRQHAAVSDGNTVAVTPTMSTLAFRPDGTVRGVAGATEFQICTTRHVFDGRERNLRIEVSGYVQQTAFTCNEK